MKHSVFTARLAVLLQDTRKLLPVLAVFFGCGLFGAATLQLPKHVQYHKARVTRLTIRHGSKQFGVRLFAKIPSGRSLTLSSRRYNPCFKEGALICVQELSNQLRPNARTRFQLAMPHHCAAGSGFPPPPVH